MKQEPLYLPVTKIAAVYGGSTRFWRREIWARRLESVRLGSRVYVAKAALDKYVADRTTVSSGR